MNNKKYASLFDLSGKTAIVTGGMGILGRCFCAGLAEFGANVAIIDLDEVSAMAYAKKLSSLYNIGAIGIGCDISSPEAVKTSVQHVIDEFGGIHILHNNAQGETASVPFEECTLEQWKMTAAVNEDGYFLMAQAVGEFMVRQKLGGSIIQTSSIYGIMGPDHRIYQDASYEGANMGTRAVYSFTKAGVVGLTKYLATYWADKGIRVNTISPGGVESGQNEIFNQKYSERIPLGRMAKREEMVGALLYLASNASSYVTGQNIIVDGGLDAW
jgi:NAD(P)-dependent dehydrogenase (short-subunit alcohol dehydrogenase family)